MRELFLAVYGAVLLAGSASAQTDNHLRDFQNKLIWKGPLKDQADKELLKAGETGDVKMLLGLNVYVKGVVGALPVSK